MVVSVACTGEVVNVGIDQSRPRTVRFRLVSATALNIDKLGNELHK